MAQSVVRHVHVPVLLVRAASNSPAPALAPREPVVRHILIALDGSPFGEQVIPHAATLATLMGAEVTLLSVVQPILAAEALASFGAPVPQREEAEDSEVQSVVLERIAVRLRDRCLTVHAAAIVDGNPARAIIEYAGKHDVDLIAMTTHGRGALKRLVAGSVSREVLRASPTAVLMYHPDKAAESS